MGGIYAPVSGNGRPPLSRAAHCWMRVVVVLIEALVNARVTILITIIHLGVLAVTQALVMEVVLVMVAVASMAVVLEEDALVAVASEEVVTLVVAVLEAEDNSSLLNYSNLLG